MHLFSAHANVICERPLTYSILNSFLQEDGMSGAFSDFM